MATKKHYCFQCGKDMTFDPNLTIRAKSISGWWCMTCDIVELVYTQKVKNAVKSAKRFLLHGDLGENTSSTD